jgi:putative ABC transport system substrate-binding protein
MLDAFERGLNDHGWFDGRNVHIETRWAAETAGVPEAVAQLLQMRVDVLFGASSLIIGPARALTAMVPIVFATHADPVGVGDVTSLAHPGGNVTGLSMLLTEIVAKELELLRELLPRMVRVGILHDPATPSHGLALSALKTASYGLGLETRLAPASTPEELDVAIASLASARVDGLLVVGAFVNFVHRDRVAALTRRYTMPSMFAAKENVTAGGLISYGPNYADLVRRSAAYVDRILKGAKPADLPVEQASSYELAINLRTAKTLDVSIPPTLLARADEVIE